MKLANPLASVMRILKAVLAVVVVIGAAGAVLLIARRLPGLEATDAAWLQAVGSVGAILVAVWVAVSAHEKVREAAREDHYAEQSRVAWLCECACTEALNALAEAAAGDVLHGFKANSERVLRSAETMRAMLTQAIPNRLVAPMFQGIAAVEDAWSDIQMLRSSLAVPNSEDWFKPHIDLVRQTGMVCQKEHLRLARLGKVQTESTQRVTVATADRSA